MFIQKILSICKKYENLTCMIDKNNHHYSWSKYTMTAIEIASSLYNLGIKKNDTICLNCYNSPQWFFISLACIYGGIIFIPVLIEDQPELLDKILKENKCKAIFFDNEELISKLKKKKLIKICLKTNGSYTNFLYWNIFLKKTNENYIEPILPDENKNFLVYKLYDSNYSLINIYSQQIIQNIQLLDTNYNFDKPNLISYLPLNEFMTILIDFFNQIYHQGIIYFIDQNNLSNINSFFTNVQEIKPTLFISVPYIWNKLIIKINSQLEYFKNKLFLHQIIIFIKLINNKFHLIEKNKNLIIYWFLFAVRLVTDYFTNYLKKQIGLENCILFLNILKPLNKYMLEELSCYNITIRNIVSSSRLPGIICLNNIFNSSNMGYPNHNIIISNSQELLVKNQYTQSKFKENNNYLNTNIKANKLINGKLEIFSPITNSIFIDIYKYLNKLKLNFEDIIDINEKQVIFIVFNKSNKSKLNRSVKKYLSNCLNTHFNYIILLSESLSNFRNNQFTLNKNKLVEFYKYQFI